MNSPIFNSVQPSIEYLRARIVASSGFNLFKCKIFGSARSR